jgi:hypothetical protein
MAALRHGMRVFTDTGIRIEIHADERGVVLLADRRGSAVGSWFTASAEAEIDEPVVLLEPTGVVPLPLGSVVNIIRVIGPRR